MCTNNQCFEQKNKKYTFSFENKHYTVVKYCCIFHGRVRIMLCEVINYYIIYLNYLTKINTYLYIMWFPRSWSAHLFCNIDSLIPLLYKCYISNH